jgi:phosphoglycolate phosphatase-like HAD superfamily hydrolase
MPENLVADPVSATAARDVVALFDIDGTLIRAGDPAHRAAFDHALASVFAVPATLDGVPLAGRLDREIARLALAPHGIGPVAVEARLDELVTVMGGHYAAAVGRGDRLDHLLPGVAATASALRAAGVALAVVTGSARPVARAKLAAAHLDGLFPVGAYGDEADDRAELVRRGIAGAEAHYGRPFPPARAIVIGDTPLDVRAARTAGTRALAVCTGAAARTALEEAHPDAVLDDLADAEQVLQVVLDGDGPAGSRPARVDHRPGGQPARSPDQ